MSVGGVFFEIGEIIVVGIVGWWQVFCVVVQLLDVVLLVVVVIDDCCQVEWEKQCGKYCDGKSVSVFCVKFNGIYKWNGWGWLRLELE